MSPLTKEVENFQTQPHCPESVDSFCNGNDQERELEESLSLSDLPLDKINIGNQEGNVSEEESNQNAGEFSDNDFDFGSLVGSIGTLDGEMCAADEVFSGGQILPYRNSVSSISGLRTLSRSDSDRRGFESRSSSSRSSSIRSHYSTTSSGSGSSAKTVPLVSKSKIRNQFHSYPSPKPQVLGAGTRSATCTTPPGRKSKMWEVLRLGLVRTPEIELHDLKQRHRIANNHGKIIATIPRNNSIGSSSTTKSGVKINEDRARNSFSIDGNKITDFMSEIQKRKNQLPENKSNSNSNGNGNGNGGNGNNSGLFKSCKCSVGAIEPIQSTRSNSGVKNGEIGSGNNKKIVKSSQNISEANEDKNLGQKKIQVVEEQKHHQKQSRNNYHFRQGKQNLSHHQHHHHHRTFEWLKNLSHASVLNS